jgi:hypothetical protein
MKFLQSSYALVPAAQLVAIYLVMTGSSERTRHNAPVKTHVSSCEVAQGYGTFNRRINSNLGSERLDRYARNLRTWEELETNQTARSLSG